MTPLEVVKHYEGREMSCQDDDDLDFVLSLKPGLRDEEIRDVERKWPCPLPDEMRELLAYCSGLENGPLECLDFDDTDGPIQDTFEMVPTCMNVGEDGFGNGWVLELWPDSKVLGPVWYVCHDAPVLLYQSDTFSEFLLELFKMHEAPYKSLVDDVHEDRIRDVWNTNPDVVSVEDCRMSGDDVLRSFANELPDGHLVIDLRDAKSGDGFSWGRMVLETISRCGQHQIFGFKRQVGIIERWFGRIPKCFSTLQPTGSLKE
mgnify:CR=1 FL=1